MEGFLVPQVLIDNLSAEIQKYPVFEEKDRYFEQLSSNPLKESDVSLLRKLLKKETKKFDQSMFPAELQIAGYDWTQDEDMITIKYKSEAPIRIEDIEIKPPIIDSQFLSGEFYGNVKDFDLKVERNTVTIQLQTDTPHWPILIVGGHLDLQSAFLLGTFSQKCNLIGLFELCLIYAGWRSHAPSMSALAFHYLQNGKNDSAFYWFANSFVKVGDNLALYFAGEILQKSNDAKSLIIAENIMCELAKNGFSLAFRSLGYMHMRDDVFGFKANPHLAIEYLKTAGLQFGDTKSLIYLGQCYLNGIIVEKNEEYGEELLRKAGSAATEILAAHEEEKKRQEEEKKAAAQKAEEEKISVIDIAAAAGIIGAAIGAGVFIFKKFFKRK